jgi:hypothetical protein
MLKAFRGARILDCPASLPSLSLESRLVVLHRRCRLSFFKHLLAAMGPALVGMSLVLLLVALGAPAGSR